MDVDVVALTVVLDLLVVLDRHLECMIKSAIVEWKNVEPVVVL